MKPNKLTYQERNPPFKYGEQVKTLLERGLIADSKDLEKVLQSINYYRFKGYLFSFREKNSENFSSGTTLEQVLNCYNFDNLLRLLIIEAIGNIEIAIRSHLAYEFVHKYNSTGYIEHNNLQGFKKKDHKHFLTILDIKTKKSQKEDFVKNFKRDHHNEPLPLWMAIELMDMGNITNFYKAVSYEIREKIAAHFNLPSGISLKQDVFYSWLNTLLIVRNRCAHHLRFWNTGLTKNPLILHKENYPEWHSENKINHHRSGFILFMCRYLLKQISPPSDWHIRVEKLFADYPMIPIAEMGLSENWQEHLVWKD